MKNQINRDEIERSVGVDRASYVCMCVMASKKIKFMRKCVIGFL